MNKIRWGFLSNNIRAELKGSYRYFIHFFLSIVIGIGAMVAINGFSHSLTTSVGKMDKALLGGDVLIRSRFPLQTEEAGQLKELVPKIEIAEVQKLLTMARTETDYSRIVELKGVTSNYPFYGNVQVQEIQSGEVMVDPTLLQYLSIEIGDPLYLGDKKFTVKGLVQDEPGRATSFFAIGPRILLSLEDLKETNLIQPGSRVSYEHLIKLNDLKAEEGITQIFTNSKYKEDYRITTPATRESQINQNLNRFGSYISLVAIVALLLGGIGVATSIHGFMNHRMQSLSILKSLGATHQELVLLILGQVFCMGVLGSSAGIGLGVAVQWSLPEILGNALPETYINDYSLLIMAQGLLLGVGTAILFSLLPMMRILQVSPLSVLRENDYSHLSFSPWIQRGITGLVVIFVVLGVIWQTDSLLTAGIFIGGLAVTIVVLTLFILLTLRVLRSIRPPSSFPVRYGLSNLMRPGNQLKTTLLALSMSIFLILTLSLMEQQFRKELDLGSTQNSPNFFFIDIQRDQRQPMEDVAAEFGYEKPVFYPMVLTRIRAINGLKPGTPEFKEAGYGRLRSEYRITYGNQLQDGNEILEGEFWGESYSDASNIQISIEEGAAEERNLKIGDSVTFDIYGRKMEAKITSLRYVDWKKMRPNFFMQISPGFVDKSPHQFITSMNTPDFTKQDLEKRVEFVKALNRKLNNVTVIDLRPILRTVLELTQSLVMMIQFLALFCLAAGVIILGASIASNRKDRLKDMALFKLIGTTHGIQRVMLLVEYGVLGVLAVLAGYSASILTSWVIATQIFEFQYDFVPSLSIIVTVFAVPFLIMIFGLLNNEKILRLPAMENLGETA